MRNEHLSMESIAKLAPSALAVEPYRDRSARYAFIPTTKVIEGMIRAGFAPVHASQSTTRNADKANFTKHMLRFRATSQVGINAIVGDSVLEAVLINSHDGTSRYKLFLGCFRFVCSNGMVVADSLVGSINIMHTGNIVQRVIESTEHLFEQAPKVAMAIAEWRAIQLSTREQVILAESAHSLRFPTSTNDEGVEVPNSTKITPEMLLAPRRGDDQGSDLWSTFNRVQENSLKGAEGRIPDQRRPWRSQTVRSRGITGIDQDVKLNRALWSLAEKMAEEKNKQ